MPLQHNSAPVCQCLSPVSAQHTRLTRTALHICIDPGISKPLVQLTILIVYFPVLSGRAASPVAVYQRHAASANRLRVRFALNLKGGGARVMSVSLSAGALFDLLDTRSEAVL